ncbi:MAG: hypothetical protein MZV70_35115 [Desulfobacterales bacterium]|nr:hypothetical protein [Desulfobacterales bacterium]
MKRLPEDWRGRRDVLPGLELVPEPLQHGEVVVRDDVQQGVGEVGASPAAAGAPTPVRRPVPDRAEAVPGNLLERQDPERGDDDADLLVLDGAVGLAGDHLGDQEKVGARNPRPSDGARCSGCPRWSVLPGGSNRTDV